MVRACYDIVLDIKAHSVESLLIYGVSRRMKLKVEDTDFGDIAFECDDCSSLDIAFEDYSFATRFEMNCEGSIFANR